MKWYYQHNKKMFGPIEEKFLVDLLMIGEIEKNTLCCQEFNSDWKPFVEFLELRNAFKTSFIHFKHMPNECILLSKKNEQWLQEGPYTYSEVRQKLAHGELSRMDRIWVEGFSSWVPLFKIADFQPDVLNLDTFSQNQLSNVIEMPDSFGGI